MAKALHQGLVNFTTLGNVAVTSSRLSTVDQINAFESIENSHQPVSFILGSSRRQKQVYAKQIKSWMHAQYRGASKSVLLDRVNDRPWELDELDELDLKSLSK